MVVMMFASAWREDGRIHQRVPIRSLRCHWRYLSRDTHSATPPRDESAEIDSKNA